MNVESVTKFIDIGRYSYVFEIKGRKAGEETDKTYALKRTFFYNASAVECVMRERRVFFHLLKEKVHSEFLPKLYSSSQVPHGSVTFIMNASSGLKLSDVVKERQPMDEPDARFYVAEIMCALGKLHELNIVHMNVKPGNILIQESGHVMLTNFDRSIDLSGDDPVITNVCFSGTLKYIAPEIMHRVVITTKADIWCLGMLMCSLVSNPTRATNDQEELKKMAQKGAYNIEKHGQLSGNLQTFLKLCLTIEYPERPNISELQSCEFFGNINWEPAELCRMQPPILPAEFERIERFHEDTQEPVILALATGEKMPAKSGEISIITNEDGEKSVEVISVDQSKLNRDGYTEERIAELMTEHNLQDLLTSPLPGPSN
ncbi:hypothetical protein Aperf_G00000018708 [Anoplocephala perfoliata]